MSAAYFEDHPTDPDKVILRKPKHDFGEPWSPVSIGVDVTKDGVHVVGIYALDADTSQIFYAKHHPIPQRTWVGLTPACPKGLTQYECEVEGVDLVCFLEYTPDEEGSRDSRGLLNEPGTSENLELVNAYVKSTDVDIGHLLLQYLVDHITTTALEDFKNDDY
jgi:hypothetical protein